MNNDTLRIIILVFVIIYVISPLDCPGPIDDLIVLIMGATARKRLKNA